MSGYTKMRKGRSKRIFPFLHLPAELRNKIYAYLLSTKYNKVELTYHKQGPRDSLPVSRPPHHYQFHTAILSINRQIYSEAAHVFYRINPFVSLTCRHPEFESKIVGVVVVAAGRHANNFKHHSMEVHLNSHLYSDDRRSHLPLEQFIIAGDDVPQLCNILPGVHLERPRYWIDPNFDAPSLIAPNVCVHITVLRISDVDNDIVETNNESFSVKRLLEPFRRLYCMRVRVDGHVTLSHKESIEHYAARPAPTAEELVLIVSKRRDEGNEAAQNGNLATALTAYESALDLLRSGYMRLTTYPVTVVEPEYLDRHTRGTMNILRINLRSLLASSYLKLGQYAQSYRCAQDLGLTSSHAIRYSRGLVPAGPDCGRVMFCKALAGKALGYPVQALMDLDVGRKFSPDDEAMEEERRVVCGLVRDRMDGIIQVNWAGVLYMKSAKGNKAQRCVAAQRWKDLEAVIDKEFVA